LLVSTPLGLGLAYGLKYRGLKGAALCFLGDGAVNQGAFHESLNLAALWDLPVIYIIENNGYSMGTSQQRSSAFGECLAQRADGYGMAWERFDGTDLYEVRARTQVAIERAHSESKPTLLEIATYRWEGHSVADAMKTVYRTKEEVERYQNERDPIIVWKNNLIAEGVFTEAEAKQIDKAAQKEADAAVEFADDSPFPNPRPSSKMSTLRSTTRRSLAKPAAISSTTEQGSHPHRTLPNFSLAHLPL